MTFNWIKIDLKNLILDEENYKFYETLDSTFTENKFGLKIKFKSKLIVNNNFNIQLNNSAYAKCPGDNYVTDNNLKNIEIITLNNFDKSHSANSTITDYFEQIAYGRNGSPNEFKPFVFDPKYVLYYDYDTQYSNMYDEIIFIRKKPEFDSYQRFIVNVILSDNTILSDTTVSLKMK
jgi:hypothetical protein